jgi:TolB protein
MAMGRRPPARLSGNDVEAAKHLLEFRLPRSDMILSTLDLEFPASSSLALVGLLVGLVGLSLGLAGCDLGGSTSSPPPEISSVEPTSAQPGTTVIIRGSNFGSDQSEVTVSFAGTSAPIQNLSSTAITTEVPEAATDGPVRVTVGEEDVTGPEFDVTVPAPTVSEVQPTSGQPGTAVTITGSNFGTDTGNVTVQFGTVSAPVQSVTETEIETEVPDVAEDGTISVRVEEKGTAGPEFDVIPAGQITYLQNSAVYVSKPDGSDATEVTNLGNEAVPSLSSDGSLIAFQSYDGSTWQVYTVWTDGSSLRQLTTDPAADLGPVWSPDDSRLAFSSERSGNAEIYSVNSDETDLKRVTIDAGRDVAPSWSPDGSRIAFESNRDGDRELFTINPNGANLRQITQNGLDDHSPDWSPDGTKLAFHGEQSDGSFEIYVIDVETTDVTQVTNTSDVWNRLPSWSPDGDRIVFESDRGGETAIYTIRPDGTDLKRVTQGIQPDWGPSPSQD